MKTATLCLVMLVTCIGGCKARKPKESTPSAPQKLDAMDRIIKNTKSNLNAIQVHDLQLFIAQMEIGEGRMPSKQEILDYAKKENPKLYKILDDGAFVLTGTKVRESVWAYEKDADSEGGWVVSHAGEQKLKAEEVRKLLGK
jgi:hypothetical protein